MISEIKAESGEVRVAVEERASFRFVSPMGSVVVKIHTTTPDPAVQSLKLKVMVL